MMLKYYLTYLLAIVGFVSGILIIPNFLHDNPPIDQQIFVVDNLENVQYIDTLTISNRPLDFQMNKIGQEGSGQLKIDPDQSVLYSKFYFNNNPKLILWIGFMSIGLAFALGMLPFLIHKFKAIDARGKGVAMLVAIVCMTVVFIFSHYGTARLTILPPNIILLAQTLFYPNPWILQVLVSIYLLPPFFALASNILITHKLIRLHVGKDSCESQELMIMKKQVLWLLMASSIMLVMGIVTSSLLRESIIGALGDGFGYIFPYEFVLAYAFVFTFFLLVLPGKPSGAIRSPAFRG